MEIEFKLIEQYNRYCLWIICVDHDVNS
jgi:hypothetical protein